MYCANSINEIQHSFDVYPFSFFWRLFFFVVLSSYKQKTWNTNQIVRTPYREVMSLHNVLASSHVIVFVSNGPSRYGIFIREQPNDWTNHHVWSSILTREWVRSPFNVCMHWIPGRRTWLGSIRLAICRSYYNEWSPMHLVFSSVSRQISMLNIAWYSGVVVSALDKARLEI